LDRRRIFPSSGVCNQRDCGLPGEVSVMAFSQPWNSPNMGKPSLPKKYSRTSYI
jgi:hypothetical protein